MVGLLPRLSPGTSPSGPQTVLSLLLEERVGIEIHTDDIGRWVMQIEIAGVDTHNEGHRGTQHIRQH